MRRIHLIAIFLVSACCGFAQQVETSRFEVNRWSKKQGCQFVSFGEQGGMMVNETEKTDKEKNRLWSFTTLDTSLYALRNDQIGLPDHMKLFDSKSSSRWAAFVFVDEKSSKSDSLAFWILSYHIQDQKFDTIIDKLPERTTLQSVALIDGTLMFSVNGRSGDGFLSQYNLDSHFHRAITPAIDNDYVLFQLATVPETREFVLAAREFVEKRYKATNFFVYSKEGNLLKSHRYENGENAGLGRMCFAFDAMHQLVVYATLERENNKKVTAEGMTEDFSKMAVGVVWIKFAAAGPITKTYLFKNLPDIDQALTSSDRLKVKEEMLKMKKGKKKEKGEISFQFYTPRLVEYAGNHVFAAEAFQPIFHTETRMEYGYYSYFGTYPVNYVVFDGYDFFSEILLAFDEEGELKWHNTVRYENELCDELSAHAAELVAFDELVVCSPSQNTLRYEVFDRDGSLLLNQQIMPLDFLFSTDSFEDEYDAGISPWFGNRYLIHGCQRVQNPVQRNTHRTVFYVQKIQYE